MILRKIAFSAVLIMSVLFNQGCSNPAANTGAIYNATMTGSSEIPPNTSRASGNVKMVLSSDEKFATVTITLSGLEGNLKYAYVMGPATNDQNTTNVVFPMNGALTGVTPLTPSQVVDLKSGLMYVNIYTDKYPAGEIRGQLK